MCKDLSPQECDAFGTHVKRLDGVKQTYCLHGFALALLRISSQRAFTPRNVCRHQVAHMAHAARALLVVVAAVLVACASGARRIAPHDADQVASCHNSTGMDACLTLPNCTWCSSTLLPSGCYFTPETSILPGKLRVLGMRALARTVLVGSPCCVSASFQQGLRPLCQCRNHWPLGPLVFGAWPVRATACRGILTHQIAGRASVVFALRCDRHLLQVPEFQCREGQWALAWPADTRADAG